MTAQYLENFDEPPVLSEPAVCTRLSVLDNLDKPVFYAKARGLYQGRWFKF
jgi:hypothetical protein